jgi:hypothetical protein
MVWCGFAVRHKRSAITGIPVDEEYEQLIKKSVGDRVAIKKLKKEKKRQEEMKTSRYGDWWDDEYAFIAGYTSGGAPYGIRHDDLDENGNFKSNQDDAIDNDELPF